MTLKALRRRRRRDQKRAHPTRQTKLGDSFADGAQLPDMADTGGVPRKQMVQMRTPPCWDCGNNYRENIKAYCDKCKRSAFGTPKVGRLQERDRNCSSSTTHAFVYTSAMCPMQGKRLNIPATVTTHVRALPYGEGNHFAVEGGEPTKRLGGDVKLPQRLQVEQSEQRQSSRTAIARSAIE